MKFLLVLLIINLSFDLAQSQDLKLRFEYLTDRDGLSHSKVNSIYQDSRGYIWFGTNDGLNRYDGYDITVFQHELDDANSLSHNLVRDIHEDKLGNLWIGTDAGGLNLYDRSKDRFLHFRRDPLDTNSLVSNRIRQIISDDSGNLWIATMDGVDFFNQKTGKFKHLNVTGTFKNRMAEREINPLFSDSRGRIWIAGLYSGLKCIDPLSMKYITFNSDISDYFDDLQIYAFGEDNNNRIWIGAWEGLFVFDQTNNLIKKVESDQGEGLNEIRQIIKDRSGNLWFGTRSGLFIYHADTEKISFHNHLSDGKFSLNHQSVLCIFIDNNDDVWVGTREGVNYFIRIKAVFKVYTYFPNDNQYLNDKIVYAIYEDDDGILWIGTEGGGINRLDRNTNTYTYYTPDPDNPFSIGHVNVKTIIGDTEDNLWVGTYRTGLYYFDKETGRFTSVRMQSNGASNRLRDNIYSIIEDKNGNLWCATHEGILFYNKHNNQFKQFKHIENDLSSLSNNDCRIVYMDKSNTIWIGTFNGLNRYNPANNTFTRYFHDHDDQNSLSSSNIRCIYEDENNRFWIGTQGGGLNLMDREHDTFIHFTENDGLPNNTILGILEDNNNNLWISTNNGLSHFNRLSGEFNNFTVDDGLLVNQFNYNAYFKNKNGEMFFGGREGLISFFPEKIEYNKYVPPIEFTELLIDNKTTLLTDENAILNEPISMAESIHLSYEHSVLTIKFAALNYISSRKNQYAYMLEGFDKEWNYIGNNRSVTFTNLDPGDYSLRVKASNNHGVWNEEECQLDIHITPPFWLTWWFRISMGLIIVAAVFGSINFRTRRIIKLNRELEQRVSERTLQLEQMNNELEAFTYSVSHDLRGPLRSMRGFSGILLEEYSDKYDDLSKDYLTRIHASAKHMSQLIDDLLKLSRLTRGEKKSQPVNLSVIADTAIKSYITAQPDKKISYHIEPLLMVYGDRGLLEIMIQNLIDNGLKYSSERPESKIEVGKIINKGQVIFYIKDNGVGFDMAYSNKLFTPFERLQTNYDGTGIGLAIVKRVVDRHGGEIWAEAKPDEGATFYFTLKNNP